MSKESSSRDPVHELVREFVQRCAQDPELTAERFLAEHPEGGAELRTRLEASTSAAGAQADLDVPEATEILGSAGAGRTEVLPDREPERPAGRVIDRRYEVVRILGEGGFGKVFLVRDQHYQGELRALKTIQPELLTKPEFETRFRNEIRVLRALSHKGIPQIYNDGKTPEGELYYTMAFVDGRTLSDVLKKEAPLRPDRIVGLVRQMLHILEYAHEKGVVHRDLKPANVMLVGAGTAAEQVKVLDFGIAKVLRAEGELEGAQQTMHTSAGMGTPYYMSPEQVRGQDVDARSDLYALGIIIYQMCSGLLPFSGKTDLEIATARLERAPTPLRADLKTPAWLRQVVMQLLERNKEKRPNTKQIQELFERIARGQRDIMRSLLWVAAGMLVVALGVGWLLTGRGGEEAESTGALVERAELPALDTHVRLRGPPDGAFVRERTVLLEGDAPNRAALRAGDETVEVAQGRFRHALALPAEDGPAVIVLRDAAAPEVELARVTLVVDRSAPAIACEPPGRALETESGAHLVSSAHILLQGTIADAAPGELVPGSVELDDEALDLGPDGSFSSELALADDGTHVVRISAADRAGNVGRWSTTLVLDTRAPQIELAGDASFRTSDERAVIRGRVSEAHPGRLVLVKSDEGGAEEPLPVRDGAFETALPLALGENRWSLVAEDAAGNRSEPLQLSIEREKRGIRIADTEPKDGWSAPPGMEKVLLEGTADQTLSRLKVDGVDAEIEDGGRFTLEVALDEGSNELELVPYDADGVPGTAHKLTLKRESLVLPAGCSGVAGAGADPQGRALRVIHERTGINLLLVSTAEQAFYIGETEVTCEQFSSDRNSSRARADRLERDASKTELVFPPMGKQPIVDVTFKEAQVFCDLNGLRLPTVEEWVLVGSGPEARRYPWGEAWVESAANVDASWPAAVGSHPEDRSWCNALDMAGNVSEWCASSAGEPALRGGSWSSSPETCKLSLSKNPPRGGSDYVGFRVCLDVPNQR